MNIGQKVACINDNFPAIEKYGGLLNNAKEKPKIREVLITDDVLGEFLRFEKYDTAESHNWWIAKNFAPIDDEKIEEELKEILLTTEGVK